MMKQITRISIHQTSKVIAITYVGLAVPLAVFVFIMISLFGEPHEREYAPLAAVLYLILMPLIAYLLVALFAAIYNVVVKRFGGIEFSLEDGEPTQGDTA
ncbi:MAG: hypothetical protein ACETWG_10480 [Candidatus Neomarinimicrobiota bacterium]